MYRSNEAIIKEKHPLRTSKMVKNLYIMWQKETKLLSSSEMFKNKNYLQIISIGKPALPTLFKLLNNSSTLLFLALYKITGINPVREENHGNIPAMVADWKNWWRNSKENYE